MVERRLMKKPSCYLLLPVISTLRFHVAPTAHTPHRDSMQCPGHHGPGSRSRKRSWLGGSRRVGVDWLHMDHGPRTTFRLWVINAYSHWQMRPGKSRIMGSSSSAVLRHIRLRSLRIRAVPHGNCSGRSRRDRECCEGPDLSLADSCVLARRYCPDSQVGDPCADQKAPINRYYNPASFVRGVRRDH